MSQIPVVYVHTGKLPAYLLESLVQAKSRNARVILVADQNPAIEGIEFVEANDHSAGVAEFIGSYIHMSTNSPEFEKICIYRWIILANVVKHLGIETCYYSDSDVMLYTNVSETFSFYQEYDASYTITADQSDLRYSASGCCSFWKNVTLQKLKAFILDCYSSPTFDTLKQKWENHLASNKPGGVCDMTILYLFSKEIKFFELSKVVEGKCFDQNMLVGENYLPEEYETAYNPQVNRVTKKISWKNGVPYGKLRGEETWIQFYNLTEYARFINVSKDGFLLRALRFSNRKWKSLKHTFSSSTKN